MRHKIAATIAICAGLLAARTAGYAQAKPVTVVRADSPFSFPARVGSSPDGRLTIEAPKALYATKALKKAELSRLLQDYDPEKATVKLYGYYTLRYSNGAKTQQQKIRVPYYSFEGAGASYSLDSVRISGDTFTFRFGIPAPQGHNYELVLNWKAGKILGLRYVGQGGAGNYTMCRDYVAQPVGTPVVLDHIKPGGLCYDLTPEYEKTHFIGRGISPTNRSQLIIVDEGFRTLSSYRLRYKIRGIESGDAFYINFDDPRLKAEDAEVPVKQVIGEKRYLR